MIPLDKEKIVVESGKDIVIRFNGDPYRENIGVKITLQHGPSHWINYILSKLHYSTALPAELITGW